MISGSERKFLEVLMKLDKECASVERTVKTALIIVTGMILLAIVVIGLQII